MLKGGGGVQVQVQEEEEESVEAGLRPEPGPPMELLPPVWVALHVAVAEYTRRFCEQYKKM